MMNIPPDFEELLKLLEENKVDYLVVGGFAVAFHGYMRFTKDIDIFYDLTVENISRLKKSLLEFGFAENELPEDKIAKGDIVTFGVEPLQVDLLNEIDGVNYADASKNFVRGRFGSIFVRFIGKDDLIRNKKSAHRAKDIVDVDELE